MSREIRKIEINEALPYHKNRSSEKVMPWVVITNSDVEGIKDSFLSFGDRYYFLVSDTYGDTMELLPAFNPYDERTCPDFMEYGIEKNEQPVILKTTNI